RVHADVRGPRRLRRVRRPRGERDADPGPGTGAAVVPRWRVHPARPVHRGRASDRLLDADVRSRRDRPRPADPGAALVRRAQRGGVVGHLRGGRSLADEQGHGARVTSVSGMSTPPADAEHRTGPRRWGLAFAGIWLFYLLSPLSAAWAKR